MLAWKTGVSIDLSSDRSAWHALLHAPKDHGSQCESRSDSLHGLDVDHPLLWTFVSCMTKMVLASSMAAMVDMARTVDARFAIGQNAFW